MKTLVNPKATPCERPPEGAMLYTRGQVACLLQISVRSVDRYVQTGELTPAPIPGRLVRFRPEDVLRLLNKTAFASTHPNPTPHENHYRD